MNKDNKGTVIGLAAVVVIAIVALAFFFMRQRNEENGSTVNADLAEMKKSVPAGLGTPKAEDVTRDLHMMGGGKKNSAPGPGIAPP
jgi:hypothetical protein